MTEEPRDGSERGDRGTGGRADGGRVDGEFVAVVDRFEGDLAVLLLERGERTVADVAVPRERLPEDARRADAVLRVTVENGDLVDACYDKAATEARADSAQSRFDRLARRSRDSDGPRDDERGADSAPGDEDDHDET